MNKLVFVALMILALISGTVQANQMLAMQSGCLGCHKASTDQSDCE